MAFFNYEALKDGKNRISGKIEANSEKEARELLRKQNLLPIKLNEIGAAKPLQKRKSGTTVKPVKQQKIKNLNNREKIDFTNILYTFSKAGIALIESLYFIETNSENPKIRIMATEIRRKILAGSSLSEALVYFPKTFDDIYVGLIRAGEESGELEKTLQRISVLLTKQDRLRSKIISTLAYPIFVMILAMLVTILMLTFVFPAFKGMYDQMGADLPLITKVFMTAGLFLRTNWYLIPLIFLSVGAFFYYIFTWDVTRRQLDKFGLKIPVFEKFLRFTSISNFIMIMRVAFEAGIPLVDSLLLANYTVKNIVLRESLKKATVQVQYGSSLSAALRDADVFPGLVMCMIATGEEAGSLTEMLEQTGDYIDEQIDRVVEILSKLFEPFLFVIIGGIVLVLGLSLYLPLFQSYANIS
jgi:type II secretory pathway component PulF